MNRTPKEKLTGRLIGLARATDGNEHLRNADASEVILEGLRTLAAGADVTENLLMRIENEKRKMIPDCFVCAAPCGKNSDFDMEKLENAPKEVRDLKYQLLDAAGEKAAMPDLPEITREIFYKVLIVMGLEDYGPEDLRPILLELEQIAR